MTKVGLRRLALAGMLSFGLIGTAFAQPPATGLGQSWPNATDVSASPLWHAYVFVLGGITYVQINDLNGNVLGAVGTANGQFITLPIGAFAQLVSTPQQPAAISTGAAPAAQPSLVYQDSSVKITATPQTDATVKLTAGVAAGCDPIDCNIRNQ